MPERADDDEGFQEKAPPRLPKDEGIQPPPRPAPGAKDDDWDEPAQDRDGPRDQPRRRRPRRDDDGVSTIIPYHNGMALAGYYCGVFGLIPFFGFILAPLALIFGIVGLRRVNRNPEIKGTGHSVTAIVLGGLSSLGHYGLLIVIMGGYFLSRR